MTDHDPTNKEIEGRIGGVEAKVELLADAVVGPEKGGLAGNGREEEQGLIYKVDELIKTLQNGGLKIKLPPGVWVAIIAALAGLGVQLIATLGE